MVKYTIQKRPTSHAQSDTTLANGIKNCARRIFAPGQVVILALCCSFAGSHVGTGGAQGCQGIVISLGFALILISLLLAHILP